MDIKIIICFQKDKKKRIKFAVAHMGMDGWNARVLYTDSYFDR